MGIELQGCNAHIAYIIYDARQCTAATALPRLFLVAPLMHDLVTLLSLVIKVLVRVGLVPLVSWSVLN